MFSNNLKKIIATAIFISTILTTSLIAIIPAHALSEQHIDVNYIKLQDIINIEKVNTYCEKAEEEMNKSNYSEAQGYVDKAYCIMQNMDSIVLSEQSLKEKVDIIQDKIFKEKSNEYLKKALLSINTKDLSKACDYLITAFNYGNQINDSNVRQPIISMIIRVQNQISVWGR